MTAALADFLTKLGWSGVCVGPSKPPPGNEAKNAARGQRNEHVFFELTFLGVEK